MRMALFGGIDTGAKLVRATHLGKDLKLWPNVLIEVRNAVEPAVIRSDTFSRRLVLLMDANCFLDAKRLAWRKGSRAKYQTVIKYQITHSPMH
jgi:hypothetical protein